ncbi:MAG: hypothetical protein DLM54_04810 [Acidimicrobiales bacterium]|nr:MAG: hypothetical protein DLM54_04810 [Acidimicrobiales bacterium]
MVGVAAHITLWKVLSSAASAGIVIVTARQLGPQGRGVFVLLITLATFALLICGLGVNIAARLELVAEIDPIRCGDYLGLSLALILLQAGVCVVSVTIVAPALHVHLSLLGLGLFGVFGGSFLGGLLLVEAINAYGFTVRAAVIDAASSIVQLLIVALASSRGARSVPIFIGALTVGYLLESLLCLVALRQARAGIRPLFHWAQWVRLLRRGPPGIAVTLGQMAAFKLDRYLVVLYLTPAAVGIYSVAATFPEMLRILPAAMGQPIFYGLASGSATPGSFRRGRLLCVGLMTAAVGVAIVTAPLSVRVVFGQRYAAAVPSLRLLLLAEFGLTFYYLDSASLSGMGRVGESAKAVAVGVVLTVLGDVVLVPAHGISGAALASVIAYSAMGLVASLLLRRRLSRRALHVRGKASSPSMVAGSAALLSEQPVKPSAPYPASSSLRRRPVRRSRRRQAPTRDP